MLKFWWNNLIDSACLIAFDQRWGVKFNEDKHLVYRKQYRKKPGPSKRCQMDAIKQPRVFSRSIGGMLEEKVEFLFAIFFFWRNQNNKKTKIRVDFSRVFPLQIIRSRKKQTPKAQMSNEKNLGWLGCILPSYIGIIISHYKDPY